MAEPEILNRKIYQKRKASGENEIEIDQIKEDMRTARILLSELKYENQNNYQSVINYNRLMTHYEALRKDLEKQGGKGDEIKKIDETIKKIKSNLSDNITSHYKRREVNGASLKDATTRYLEKGESQITTPEVKEKFNKLAQELDKTDLEKRVGVGSQPKHFYEKLLRKLIKNRQEGKALTNNLSNPNDTLQRVNEQEFLDLQDEMLDIDSRGVL